MNKIDYIARYFGIIRYYFYRLNHLVYEWYYYQISRCMTVDYGHQKHFSDGPIMKLILHYNYKTLETNCLRTTDLYIYYLF